MLSHFIYRMTSSSLLNRIRAYIFSLGDDATPTIQNSVVAAITRENSFLPLQDEHFFSLEANLVFIVLYTIMWLLMVKITYQPSHLLKFIAGYLFGIILLLIEIWTYNSLDWVYVNNQDMRAYSVRYPNIINIRKGALSKTDPQSLINMEVGDYKVLLENKAIPASNDALYLIPAEKFLQYQNEGLITAEDLGVYTDGQFKHEYGYANQSKPIFSSVIEVDLSNAAFYIVIICVTWALYTSHTKLATSERLAWLISAVGLGLLTGGLMYNSGTLRQRMSFLYTLRRILILTISFAVTAVLI